MPVFEENGFSREGLMKHKAISKGVLWSPKGPLEKTRSLRKRAFFSQGLLGSKEHLY